MVQYTLHNWKGVGGGVERNEQKDELKDGCIHLRVIGFIEFHVHHQCLIDNSLQTFLVSGCTLHVIH